MTAALGFLGRNKAIILMLAFVGVFYSGLFLSSQQAREPLPETQLEKTERTAREDMKIREQRFRRNIQAKPALAGAFSLVFLLVVSLGLCLNFYFFMRKARGEELILPSLPHDAVPWGLRELILVSVFLFFAEASILFFEMMLASFINLKGIEKDFFLMANSFLRDVCVAAFVLALVTKKFDRRLVEIGLTLKDFGRNIKTGVLGYLAVIPALLALLVVLALVARAFSYEPPPQPVVEIYLKESTERYLVFFTIFVAVIGPVIEEIFFRGFAYQALRTRFGIRWGILLSAAIFALFHLNFMAFFPIFFLGAFLAYLYEKTGSLVSSMTVHMLHNLVMVTLTLGFKSLSV